MSEMRIAAPAQYFESKLPSRPQVPFNRGRRYRGHHTWIWHRWSTTALPAYRHVSRHCRHADPDRERGRGTAGAVRPGRHCRRPIHDRTSICRLGPLRRCPSPDPVGASRSDVTQPGVHAGRRCAGTSRLCRRGTTPCLSIEWKSCDDHSGLHLHRQRISYVSGARNAGRRMEQPRAPLG